MDNLLAAFKLFWGIIIKIKIFLKIAKDYNFIKKSIYIDAASPGLSNIGT